MQIVMQDDESMIREVPDESTESKKGTRKSIIGQKSRKSGSGNKESMMKGKHSRLINIEDDEDDEKVEAARNLFDLVRGEDSPKSPLRKSDVRSIGKLERADGMDLENVVTERSEGIGVESVRKSLEL